MLRNVTGILVGILVSAPAMSASAQTRVPGEVIVKLKSGKLSASGAQNFHAKLASQKGLALKGGWSGLHMYRYKTQSAASVDALLNELQQDESVEYAEPNFYVKKSEVEDTSAIQKFSQQDIVAMTSNQPLGSFALTTAPIQANESWSQLKATSTSVPVVAVIDSGVEYTHFALSNAIWSNAAEVNGVAGVDDDGNGYIDDIRGWNFADNNNNPMDCDGHGTHVAGIVRGAGQDIRIGDQMPALIKIMPLKFLDCWGSGSTADAINAIYYAVNNGAQILNNSWGGGNYSRALHDALAHTYAHNTMFFAAAGNSAGNNDAAPLYPASYDVPNVVAVAATSYSSVSHIESLASFSNYGSHTVHIGAPGVGILSTYTGNQFSNLSGTSMATPMMAGIAALMLRERPDVNAYQMKTILMGATDAVSSLSTKTATGGRINALKAIQNVKVSTSDSYMPSYAVQVSGQDRELASNLASGGGGCGMVKSVLTGGGGGSGGGGLAPILVGMLLMLPVLVWVNLKREQFARTYGRRKFDRFAIDSTMRMKVGGQEIVGHVSTISQGGAGFDAQTLIEKGSVVTMMIESPDGKEKVEVQGQVVWSNESHAYGVQFTETTESIRTTIAQWTKSLVRT
ncbi:MAG: S8 family serine peptidase [Bdellovibrionales bacterium]|nr:S8 family serine peptidase [Bdellovibrionales bacterium]